MIKFNCSSCQRKIGIKDEAVGRKLKCPQCGDILTVPGPSAGDPADEQMKRQTELESRLTTNIGAILLSETRRKILTNIMPLWMWFVCLCWLFILVFGLLFYFSFRDTWERDNYEKIKSLSDQALSMSFAKDYDECFKTYDDLFKLVENHRLKYSEDIISQAKLQYQQTVIDYEHNLLPQLQSQLLSAKQAIQRGDYRYAVKLHDDILKRSGGKEIKTNELKSFLDLVQTQQQLVKSQMAELEKLIKDYACKELTDDIEFDKINEIERGLYELSGDGEIRNRMLRQSVGDWGVDSDSLKARETDLREKGYVPIRGSGGEYGKIVRRADRYVCQIRYYYENNVLKFKLEKCEVNGFARDIKER
jgi:hypothetical protein